MQLLGRLVPIDEVTSERRDAMFALMEQYYENVRRANFESDLDEKHWVIEVIDPATDTLCGFSTQMLLEAEVGGRPIKALFSGDTIIARAHWGDSALSHVWGRLALLLIDSMPESELYWFLISKGYKTYRFLPVFFHEFFPRHDRATPGRVRTVLDTLSLARYPRDYDPVAGIIRGHARKDRLRPEVADLTAERLRDPHVAYFARRNPGHRGGDELCCLAPLSRANFKPAAYRVIGQEPSMVGVPG